MAVERWYCDASSTSVRGTRFTKTRVPAISISARLPPIPEPSSGAAAIISANARSLSRESRSPTTVWAAARATPGASFCSMATPVLREVRPLPILSEVTARFTRP